MHCSWVNWWPSLHKLLTAIMVMEKINTPHISVELELMHKLTIMHELVLYGTANFLQPEVVICRMGPGSKLVHSILLSQNN